MYQYKIRTMMEEFRKQFNATPLILRMPEDRFEEFVSELKLQIGDFKPLDRQVWDEALAKIGGPFAAQSVKHFTGMQLLEFQPRAFYAGMLVGVSEQYKEMAVAFRVSVEMDTETSGVVYETSLFNA